MWSLRDTSGPAVLISMSKHQDETTLNKIFLTHPQARWVLMQFNQHFKETEDDFEKILNKLKKLGVPFAPQELTRMKGVEDRYLYENLMELFLLMRLRVCGYDVQDLARLIVKHRAPLREMFTNAYFERQTGRGTPRRLFVSKPITRKDRDALPEMVGQIELTTIRGMYLDLQLSLPADGELDIINLELIGPEDAASQSMLIHRNIYPYPPLPISNMADDLVRIATGPLPSMRTERSKFLR